MKRFTLVLLAIFLLAGCATVGLEDLNHKQQAVVYSDIWSSQYDAYAAKQDGPLTKSDRQIMPVQRKLLMDSKEWLALYIDYADSGAIPPEKLSKNLSAAILQLVNLATKEAN